MRQFYNQMKVDEARNKLEWVKDQAKPTKPIKYEPNININTFNSKNRKRSSKLQ